MATAHPDVQYFTAADGLKLAYRHYASDSDNLPLLCLHGLTRNSRDFLDFAQQFNDRHPVIALDTRGRGFSEYDDNWQNYTIEVYVNDVLALLDHLAVERVILVGTSMGGLISMAMFAQRPDKIAAMVLNDVGPELNPAGIAVIARRLAAPSDVITSWEDAYANVKKYNQAALPGMSEQQWQQFARNYFREKNGIPVQDFDSNLIKAFMEVAEQPLVDIWPLFETITCPVLALRGELSDLLSADTFSQMAQRNNQVTTVTIPNRGHAPMLDEPHAIEAIEQFISQLG